MPARDGVDATRVVLRPDLWPSPELPTVLQALLAAPVMAGVDPAEVRRQAAGGAVVDADGRPVELDAPVRRPVPVYLYRELEPEPPVPFGLPILYRDTDLVVVDKPHFLATMPRGTHVTQTALVRLRRELGNDQLAPAHRLDRLTAGVLLLTQRPGVRAAYHQIFARREAHKEYRALAPADERLTTTLRVSNRIEKGPGDLRSQVVSGPPNAVSDITLERVRPDGLGEYRLVPHTGRTHQLRVHMAGLGLPIVGDPLYPEVDAAALAAPGNGDFSSPLHLVAAVLEFTDPCSGNRRRFTSARAGREFGAQPPQNAALLRPGPDR